MNVEYWALNITVAKSKSDKEKDELIETFQSEVKKMCADMEMLQKKRSAAQSRDESQSTSASESTSSLEQSKDPKNDRNSKYLMNEGGIEASPVV